MAKPFLTWEERVSNIRRCAFCGKAIFRRNNKYCSMECKTKAGIFGKAKFFERMRREFEV